LTPPLTPPPPLLLMPLPRLLTLLLTPLPLLLTPLLPLLTPLLKLLPLPKLLLKKSRSNSRSAIIEKTAGNGGFFLGRLSKRGANPACRN
jgi:hypothetical protein